MRVIPVIDLKGGLVVRGVAGRRREYRPVESRLAADARPATIARAFVDRFGFSLVYAADLDAIEGAEPDRCALEEIAGAGLELLVDAGIRCATRARALSQLAPCGKLLRGVIVGLESIPGPRDLAEVFEILGPDRAIFSVDLKHGQPLTDSASWRGHSLRQITDCAVTTGFRKLIVLDVARVGMGHGPSVEPICRAVRAEQPHIELISGGGVRGLGDLNHLVAAGCDAVLVATALHNGRLNRKQVETLARR